MQQIAKTKKKHAKLKVAGGIIILLIAGFFIYKYSYIYIERRKYDQATVAINKVAADLRAQGIETTFSKGCGKGQEVFGGGVLSCDVGITSKSNLVQESEINKMLAIYSSALSKAGFSSQSANPDLSTIINSGSIPYSYKVNGISCSLTHSKNENSNQYDFGCSDNQRFQLF